MVKTLNLTDKDVTESDKKEIDEVIEKLKQLGVDTERVIVVPGGHLEHQDEEFEELENTEKNRITVLANIALGGIAILNMRKDLVDTLKAALADVSTYAPLLHDSKTPVKELQIIERMFRNQFDALGVVKEIAVSLLEENAKNEGELAKLRKERKS